MNNKKIKMEKRIQIIKNFAREMGYKVLTDSYKSCTDNRPMISVELIGTFDSESNPYSWCWYVDTYDEYKNIL